jgi:hypothetical protein
MRPLIGLANGREVSLCSVAHASESISALKVVFNAASPRQKPAQISPIFIGDKVTLHVSREKGGKWRLFTPGGDDTKVVQPDGCGQARRGWKGESYPLAREAAPPSKIETPQGTPFTQR